MEDLQPDARTIARIPARIAFGNWGQDWTTATRPASIWLPVSAGAAFAPLFAPPWVGMLVIPEELARGSIPAASIFRRLRMAINAGTKVPAFSIGGDRTPLASAPESGRTNPPDPD